MNFTEAKQLNNSEKLITNIHYIHYIYYITVNV